MSLYRELEQLVAPQLLSYVLHVVERHQAGESAPQCPATWPEDPTPEMGFAACLFREGHAGLHCRGDGSRWENGGQLLTGAPVDADFEEQAGFWLQEVICGDNPQTAEYAAYVVSLLRRLRAAQQHSFG